MKILLFGIAKQLFGADTLKLKNGEATSVKQLRQILEFQNPQLKELRSYMVAVNKSYAEDDMELKGSDEIAIIPPVSGG